MGFAIADAHGFGGLYEWSTFFLGGTGLATALFWGRRRAGWFWPTVIVVVAAHIVVLYALKWRVITPGWGGSAQQFNGAVGLDFAVNALVFYIVHGFCDPTSVAKTQPEAIAKAIKLGFALLCLTIPVALILVVMQAHQRNLAALRLVFIHDSPYSAQVLMDCLERPSRHQEWEDAKTSYPAKEYFEWDLDKRVRIFDRHTIRQIQVETLHARPLYPEETKLLSSCLMP